MGVLRGNSDRPDNNVQNAASAFARMALGHVGGSSVFIEPKKTGGKLLDTDAIK
jgi:hypothetical protein